MSELKPKLAAILPKGELNGIDDFTILSRAANDTAAGRSTGPMVFAVVARVKKVEIDPSGDTRTVHYGISYLQPVQTDAGRRAVERVLIDEYSHQTGEAILPHEVRSVIKAASEDLPRTDAEIDEMEEGERAGMSPDDELAQHLRVVHGYQAGGMTGDEMRKLHQRDHARGDLPESRQHAPEWIGWTRADLEQQGVERAGEQRDPDGDKDEDAGAVLPMFSNQGD